MLKFFSGARGKGKKINWAYDDVNINNFITLDFPSDLHISNHKHVYEAHRHGKSDLNLFISLDLFKY
jgi:hypothetical protein